MRKETRSVQFAPNFIEAAGNYAMENGMSFSKIVWLLVLYAIANIMKISNIDDSISYGMCYHAIKKLFETSNSIEEVRDER